MNIIPFPQAQQFPSGYLYLSPNVHSNPGIGPPLRHHPLSSYFKQSKGPLFQPIVSIHS